MWISALGVVVCIIALGALVWHQARSEPAKLWVLLIMTGLALGAEAAYRFVAKRELRKPLQKGHGE